MKIKQYIICGSILAITLIGGAIVSSANEKSILVDGKDIVTSYDNLIKKTEQGIEHLILIESDGTTLDIYRDRNSGKERVDYYDENGLLVERSIATNFGEMFLTLSQFTNENGKLDYTIIKTLPPKDAVLENKEIMKKSMIDGYLREEFINGVNGNWKKVNVKDNLVKYSDENHNIYIDSSSGDIVKREILSNDKIVKTLEVEVLQGSQNNIDEVFAMDAPLIKQNAVVGNKSIKEINEETDIEIDDNSNVEYDSNQGRG